MEWSSPLTATMLYSGWLGISADNKSDYKFYVIDESSLKVMIGIYSGSVLYQYNFTGAEPYRQVFKIFDITTANITFDSDDPAYYFSYPVLWDADADGSLECSFSVYDYPNFANYNYEVYNTGISTGLLTGEEKPNIIDLRQNYPNSFNPSITIEFDLNRAEEVSLNIYDVLVQKVSTIINHKMNPGNHKIDFDGSNLSSGTYFYELKTGAQRETKKMILINEQ